MLRDTGTKGKMPMTTDRIHPVRPEERVLDRQSEVQGVDLELAASQAADRLRSTFEVGNYRDIFEHSLSGFRSA